MSSDPRLAEVEPGLRLYELQRAVRNVREAAEPSNYGFMLAYQTTPHLATLSFSFIVRDHGFFAALYAHAAGRTVPLEFTAAFHEGCDEDGRFMQEHFRTTAKMLGVTYVALVNHLAEKSTQWRFESWVDGKHADRWADNSAAWRPLWGRLAEAASVTRLPAILPIRAREVVVQCLRFHASEGQCVLDR